MARMSDLIEEFLKQLMSEMNGVIEIQRNELANHFNCVPSQINYVIDTRFTTERGYYVESRRGGGGHIRIKRINMTNQGAYLMHIISAMGNSITQQNAEIFINNFVGYDMVTQKEGLIIKAAISDKTLSSVNPKDRDYLRAIILKNMLMSLISGSSSNE
jgi:transcriptional regulator CtsR